MKIALTRREYITHLDGVNRFIALLAEGLARLGHEPVIVSWCHRGVDRSRLEGWFKEVHGLDNPLPIYTLRSGPCEGDPWLAIALDWLTKGSRLLVKEGVEAAIVNGVIPLRLRPKIAIIHDMGPAFTNRFFGAFAKRILKSYDALVCVSRKTRGEVRDVLGLNCNHVIPIPMKLRSFRYVEPGERENIIVHIGTRPIKNPHISIEASKILRKRGYDIKLVIVGPQSNPPRVKGVEYRYAILEEEKLELLHRAKA